MRVRGLVNTDATIALLDRDDRWHRPCVEALPQFLLPLVTSAAVLAELFHLLGHSVPDSDVAWGT